MLEFVVENEQELLTFLYDKITDYNKKQIKNFLVHESIYVNDKIITKYNYLLKTNQVVKVNIYNKSKNIDIVYEDNDIIVVDKEEGILSVSNEKTSETTMYNLVSDYVKSKSKRNKIFVIHRLDKETSGLLMFAKNEKIKYLYQDNWDDLVIKREYLAIVNGKTKNSGTIKSYLTENKNHYVYSSNTGKLAITHYKKIKETNNYTYLSVVIDTGRKNQIRVHMKDLGNPIVGDTKYGKKDNKFKRLCLHAYKLVIINPINKKEMEFKSNIPKEFK